MIVDCREDGDVPSVVFFFPAGKTAWADSALGADAGPACLIGAFSCSCTIVTHGLAQVKCFTKVTLFEPECSHTAAVVFGFETNSIFVFIPPNLNKPFLRLAAPQGSSWLAVPH